MNDPDHEVLPVQSSEQPVFLSEPVLQPPLKLKHSGPGIASFVISILSLLGYGIFAAYSINVIAQFGRNQLALTEANILQSGIIVVTLIFLGCIALNLIGTVVGVIGLALKNRKKTFAIIGTILNGLMLVLFIILITYGLSQVPNTAGVYSTTMLTL